MLRNYRDFLGIEAEWRELHEAAGAPFSHLRHGWLRAGWEVAFHRFPNRLRVVLVWRDGRLSVAGAFVLGFRGLRPVATLLSSALPHLDEVLWRPSAFALDDTVLMLRALSRDSPLPLWLDLHHIRDDSMLQRAILAGGFRREVRQMVDAVSLALEEHAGFAEYFETLSHNLRVDHRRRLRRFREMPGFAHVVESAEAGRDTLRWLLAAKRDWLADREARARWLSSGLVDRIYERLSVPGPDQAGIRVASLRVEGRMVAAALSFAEPHRLQYAVMSQDPAFDKHSPGRTLALLEIADAFERGGLREFDLGYGTVGWKNRLAGRRRVVTTERIHLP